MKKLLTITLIMLVCLQAFSTGVVLGDTKNADYISVYTEGLLPDRITKGNEVSIRLTFVNVSGPALTNVSFSIDQDSSFKIDGQGTIKLRDSDIAPSSQSAQSFNFIYTGTGNELKFTLKYSDGGPDDFVQSQSIYIKQASPGSTSSNNNSSREPADTSRYQPMLSITSQSSTSTVLAGNAATLNYAVKNNSDNPARDINMTLELEDREKAPYILEQLDLRQTIDELKENETKTMPFKIRVLKTAPEGIYAIKVSYKFTNLFGDPFNTTETVYLKVQNDNILPRLTVDSITMAPAGDAAGTAALTVNIKNIGNLPAKDIKVTLKGLKSGGLTTYNSTDVKYVAKISGNAGSSVTYQLLVPDSGASASNELSVKMDYRDEMGSSYSEENQIFVPVSDVDGGKPAIAFENILSPQGAVTKNEYFKIGFDLKNTGDGTAKNVMVSLTSDKEVATKSLSNVLVNAIGKSDFKHVEFTLFATGDAVTKNYPVALNLQYEDAAGTKYTATQYVGVYVENETDKSVPRIIIDQYSFEPADVKAGDDFTLKLSFLNTSKLTAVSNIKVSLTSDDGIFTPSNSSNTFFMESIGSKKSVGKELTLHVKPDADAKSYILTANFEYEDEKDNPYTSKETISIPVKQNPRLVTGELSLPPETFAGQPLQVYIDFYNMGKSTLYNFMVEAKGDFQGQNLSYFVGNFESGRSDSFDASIIPNAPGTLSGNIVFSFEDANGQKSEITKEFSVNVMEMMLENAAPLGGEMGVQIGPDGKPIQPQTGLSLPVKLVIIFGALAIIGTGVTFITLRKKQKRRREMSLDE